MNSTPHNINKSKMGLREKVPKNYNIFTVENSFQINFSQEYCAARGLLLANV